MQDDDRQTGSSAGRRFTSSHLNAISTTVTAIVALGALYFTGQSLTATREQMALSERGQVTDRFAKAVEHLGSEKIDIRLGGIYSLRRLADDSPRDRIPIVRILTAFVRQNAPKVDTPACDPLAETAEDVKAALEIVGQVNSKIEFPRDLQLYDFPIITLSRICLPGILLSGVDLRRSIITDVKFNGSDFVGVNLADATITGVDFQDAIISGVDFKGAGFSQSNFINSSFENSTLVNVALEKVNFENVTFEGGDITGASGVSVTMRNVDLRGTKGAEQFRANLKN